MTLLERTAGTIGMARAWLYVNFGGVHSCRDCGSQLTKVAIGAFAVPKPGPRYLRTLAGIAFCTTPILLCRYCLWLRERTQP